MKYVARGNGNSVTVTIPIYIKEKLNIKKGDNLDIDLQGKKIIIKKENNKNDENV